MVMSQNATFASFGPFYQESDVKNDGVTHLSKLSTHWFWDQY